MTKTELEVDRMLNELGAFGAYQAWGHFWLSIPILFTGIWNSHYLFTAAEANVRCEVEACEQNVTQFETGWWGPMALPPNNPCHRYAPIDRFCTIESFNRSAILPCEKHIYENYNSIVAEFDLGCQEWKRTLVGTIHSSGMLIGLPITGLFSDLYGRRTALITTALLASLMGLIRSFSPNYIFFLVFEFLDATCGTGTYSTAFVLALEMVGLHRRVLGGSLISASFATGQVTLALIAWAVPYWRTLLRVLYSPPLLIVVYYYTIEESVRWLLSKGNKKEAARIIFKAAKINKKKLSPQSIEALTTITSQEAQEATQEKEASHSKNKTNSDLSCKRIIKSRIIMIRFCICSFWWMSAVLIYYGLSITSVALAGNAYMNFILTSLMEFPGYLMCVLCLDRFGRKSSLSCSLIVCGISLMVFPFLPEDNTWMPRALSLIAKMCISMTFSGIYIYTSELFPTNARHRLLASCSMVGRIGLLIAPQAPLLAAYMPSLPFLIFGSLALCSAGLMMLTPETLHKHLPDSIEEAERMERKEQTIKTESQN